VTLPQPVRSRALARELLALGGFLALTVLQTWPWALHLRDAVADTGDPYINAWTLWWDVHQTFTSPLHLFQANLFFPYRDTLAFSEHQYGIALLTMPLYALGLRPLTMVSVMTFAGIALSGYGAYRLARTLLGSTGAAFVAGVGFAFVPYRFHQLSHLPYLFCLWMALLFEALVLFLRERSWRRAAWLGAAFLMNALTCIHWLVLTLVPLVLVTLLMLVEDRKRLEPRLARGAVAGAFALALLLPFLLPYQRAASRYGFVRPAEEAANFSAHLRHWGTADWHSHVWRGLGQVPMPGELALFPGILLLMLPALGVALSLAAGRDRETLTIGLVLAGTGFLGSLGMNAPFHRFLFQTVPLFRSIRVPARWAMVADLGLALLAGLAALRLALWAGKRFSPRAATAVHALLSLLLLAELRTFPLAFVRGDADPDALTLHLARTPMQGGLVELPAGDDPQYGYTLRAADHARPLVNASSGFEPPIAQLVKSLWRARPIPERLTELLEEIPASYLTVHEGWLTPDERQAARVYLAGAVKGGRLRFVRRFGRGDDLYAVARTEPQAAGAVLPWDAEAVLAQAAPAQANDESLSGSLDGPPAGSTVQGALRVHGWARTPGSDLEVSVYLDGEPRPARSFRRMSRADVGFVIPQLGDTSGSGYEAIYDFRAGDEGAHDVMVVLKGPKGTSRTLPRVRFTWAR